MNDSSPGPESWKESVRTTAEALAVDPDEIQWIGPELSAADAIELEVRQAEPVPSGRVYHYTNADAGMLGILLSRSIRASPFASTNDLWEANPYWPPLSGDAEPDLDHFALWDEIDRLIRRKAKLACFTLDWQLPSYVHNPNVLRGWAHLALWAHYGGNHSGVCIGFDQQQLLDAFGNVAGQQGFSGQVKYQLGTVGLSAPFDLEYIKGDGVEAVADGYMATHREELYLRKHQDWANEHEFRLVAFNDSALPLAIDVGDAVKHVVLGSHFPTTRLPQLQEVMKSHPNVLVQQFSSHNRHIGLMPVAGFWPGVASEQDSSEGQARE